MSYLIPFAAVAAVALIVYAVVPAADRNAWFHSLSLALVGVPSGLDAALGFVKGQTADVWQTLGLDAKHAMMVILGANVASLIFHSANGNPNKAGGS